MAAVRAPSSGRARSATLTSMPGWSSTRPCCISVDTAVDVGRGRGDRRWSVPSERSVPRSAGARSSDDVELRLVALGVRDRPPAPEQVARPRRAGSSATAGTCRAGCRPTRRSARELGAVDEADAAHAVALAQDRVDRGSWCAASPPAASNAASSVRGTSPLPPTGRPTRGRRGASRCQRAEAGARRLRRDAPHHRPVERGGPEHARRGRSSAQHVGRAAGVTSAAASARRRACGAARRAVSPRTDGGSQAASSTMRIAGHRRLGVPPVAVGLVGQHRGERRRRSRRRRDGATTSWPARAHVMLCCAGSTSR